MVPQKTFVMIPLGSWELLCLREENDDVVRPRREVPERATNKLSLPVARPLARQLPSCKLRRVLRQRVPRIVTDACKETKGRAYKVIINTQGMPL